MNCPASDSICEKSGLTVPFIVRLLVIPHRTVAPTSGRSPSYSQPVPAGAPAIEAVTSGVTSNTSPRLRSVRPVSDPDCRRKLDAALRAGAQASSYPECLTCRTTFSPHVCSAAG